MKTKAHKWSIVIKVVPLVAIVAILKVAAHMLGFEVMELNTLFASLVAGTIFLLGFLVSGVLADYKESEKIPSEVACSIRTLFDDGVTAYGAKNSEAAKNFLAFQRSFAESLTDWFHRKERTKVILTKIDAMNEFFVALDKEGVQPNYIIKMKSEQHNLRKFILRIDTIRDTQFIDSAYTIVETMGFLVTIGLIIIAIEPFYASLFITSVVTYLIAYMIFLIKDLDNPFDYGEKGGAVEVSLKPIEDITESLRV